MSPELNDYVKLWISNNISISHDHTLSHLLAFMLNHNYSVGVRDFRIILYHMSEMGK